MRPTAHRRYLLRLQHRDQAGIARVALQAAVPVLQSLAAIPLSAWSDGADVGNLIRTRLAGFAPVLGDAALLAWLKGRQRAFAEAAAHVASKKKVALSAYDDALEYFAKKQNLSAKEIEQLKARFGKDAYEVLRNAGDALNDRLQATVGKILTSNVHVQGAIADLGNAFEAAGMAPAAPWTMETIARKEIISSYRAGAWEARHSPDLLEITAGLEFITAGDMSVRESHAACDSMRAPLDHPIWLQWDPETGFTGFGCRCSTLPVYKDELQEWWIPDPIPDPLISDYEGVGRLEWSTPEVPA